MRENPLNLIPASLRAEFRDRYGVEIQGELSPWAREYVERELDGGFVRGPWGGVFLSEASRIGIGTYAPHDPTTADIADLVGSVDLAKVAQIGDEGDPRAWSWSGAVYAASRGLLEMIEILKVKREFLYLLLTLTQEKNVKVSRFPLIHLDETIPAHTTLPAGEGERFAAGSYGDHQDPVRAVLPRRVAHLPEAGVGCAGVPQCAPRPARAQSSCGVRHPDAPRQVGARGTGPAQEAAAVCRRGGRGGPGDRSDAPARRDARGRHDRGKPALRGQCDLAHQPL